MGIDSQKSRSEEGYDFQFDQVQRIFKRFKGFTTVRFEDLAGRPPILDKKGPDGGLDLIIKIEAKTPAAEKKIHTIVKDILLNNDY